MTKNQKRDIATSLTTLIFLVVGTTGVMMYFHLFDKYTKELHEILGLGFVAAVVFHVAFNFKSMKQYFTKKIFYALSIVTIIVTLGFVLNTQEGEHPDKIVFDKIINGNINHSFHLLSGDIDLAKMKLEEKGIIINSSLSIKEISKANDKNPFEIIEIITSN